MVAGFVSVRRMARRTPPAALITPPPGIFAIAAPRTRGRSRRRIRPGYRPAFGRSQQASHATVSARYPCVAIVGPWVGDRHRPLTLPNIIDFTGSGGSRGSMLRKPAVFCGFCHARHGTPSRFTRGSRGSGMGQSRIRGSKGLECATRHRRRQGWRRTQHKPEPCLRPES